MAFRRFLIAIFGVIIVFIGLVLTLNEAGKPSSAYLNGIFRSIHPHSPDTPVESMNCPTSWAAGKQGQVSAKIFNSDKETHTYKVEFYVYSDNLEVYRSQATSNFTIEIPPGERMTVTADPSAPTERDLYRFAVMLAYADKDLAIPETYHFWPLSYRGFCYKQIASSQAYQVLRLNALLGLVATLVGGSIIFFIASPLTKRQLIIFILVGLLIFVIESPALGVIFMSN